MSKILVRRAVILASALALSGCGTRPPARPFSETLPQLQNRPLTMVTYKPLRIVVNTPASAFGGVIIPLFDPARRTNATSLPDPALTLVDQVGKQAATLLKSTEVRHLPDSTANPRSLDALNESSQRGGIVIDVSTYSWRIANLGFNPMTFFVDYQARLRLFDADKRTVLKESWCYFDTGKDKTKAPTADDLGANDAALLRKWHEDGVAKCAEELMKGLAA